MAVHYLRDSIPELADKIEEGLNFVAEGAGGAAVVVSQKNGRWKTRAKEISGNCLVMDSNDAQKYLASKLKKRDMPNLEIEAWAKRFADCENGQELQLTTGETFLNNEATVRLPELTSGPVDDRVAVLVAYEFLALCFGEKIFSPEFNAIRDYIRLGTKTEQVHVVHKITRQYTSDHRVRFRVIDNTLTVFVQFFRWYVFEIKFCNIPMPSQEIVYIEDLEKKQRLLALSPEDAKQGNWTVL